MPEGGQEVVWGSWGIFRNNQCSAHILFRLQTRTYQGRLGNDVGSEERSFTFVKSRLTSLLSFPFFFFF